MPIIGMPIIGMPSWESWVGERSVLSGPLLVERQRIAKDVDQPCFLQGMIDGWYGHAILHIISVVLQLFCPTRLSGSVILS